MSATPSVAATTAATRSPSWSGARSTNQTPSAKASSCWRASSCASRVLPQPPIPLSVIRRDVASSRAQSASAASRPMKRVRGCGRLVGGGPASRRRLRWPRRLGEQARGEAVAAAGDGRDRVGTEQLAQRRDLHLEVVLLDDEPRPDQVEQLALGDDAVAALEQREQQVERARAERRRLAGDRQLALGDGELEAVEAVAVGHRHKGQAAAM